VADVKHFDIVFVFVDSIVDENGAVLQFSNTGTPSNCTTHARESAEQIYVVKESDAKLRSCLGVVFCDEADDFSEVA
jgi:hypothetical protein